jgi:Flp pilus assembly protein TadG
MAVRPVRPARRRAAAAVELAFLAPVLAFLFVIAVDYCRVFYDAVILANCARNGAVYGCTDPAHAADTAGISDAALADAKNISPAPTVTSATGTDGEGNYVEVTVTHQFHTITQFPGIQSITPLTRTVRMRVSPVVPDFN